MTTFATTDERTETTGPDFDTCFCCSRELHSHAERFDGLCHTCYVDIELPMPFLPTDTGRAVLAYSTANRTFWETLGDTQDEFRVPDWDAPEVQKARLHREHVAAVLSGLDFPVCPDCTLLDCCCP